MGRASRAHDQHLAAHDQSLAEIRKSVDAQLQVNKSLLRANDLQRQSIDYLIRRVEALEERMAVRG